MLYAGALGRDIPGLKQSRGGHWNLGILRGGSGGDIREYCGLRPQYWLIGPPTIPPQDSQVPVCTPGLFQAWNIDTKPLTGEPLPQAHCKTPHGLIRRLGSL